MSTLDDLRAQIPDVARDLKLNLASVLQGGPLTDAQRWGVAAASAIASRNVALRDAILEGARAAVGDAVVEDAQAAAALMAMNNVYYRFRHAIGKEAYDQRPARLRMQRLGQPATSKADIELFSLAVSAINGCEACMVAHERSALGAGLGEDHIHEAVRIASVVRGTALALEVGEGHAPAEIVAAA